MNYEQRLISLYHEALNNNDTSSLVAICMKLAQFYYNEHEMQKAKHHLLIIEKHDSNLENLFLYLALIEIYYENLHKAKSYLKKELKNHSNNTYAKELLDKITITTNFPYGTLAIFILISIVFLFMAPQMSLSQTLLYGLSLQNFSLSTTITSLFSHYSILHFSLNAVILLSLGAIAERHIGTLHFIVFFLITGIIANSSQILLTTNSSTIVLGASGALFGIMGILLMQQPLMTLRLFGIIRVPLILVYGTLFSVSLLFSKYLYGSAELAHIIGLFCGIIYAGTRYQETIIVFYHWILITFGFYFFLKLPEELLLNQYSISTLLTTGLFSLIGIFLIVYPYIQLKKISSFTSKRGEYHG